MPPVTLPFVSLKRMEINVTGWTDDQIKEHIHEWFPTIKKIDDAPIFTDDPSMASMAMSAVLCFPSNQVSYLKVNGCRQWSEVTGQKWLMGYPDLLEYRGSPKVIWIASWFAIQSVAALAKARLNQTGATTVNRYCYVGTHTLQTDTNGHYQQESRTAVSSPYSQRSSQTPTNGYLQQLSAQITRSASQSPYPAVTSGFSQEQSVSFSGPVNNGCDQQPSAPAGTNGYSEAQNEALLASLDPELALFSQAGANGYSQQPSESPQAAASIYPPPPEYPRVNRYSAAL
ncbi:hypothetical protein VTI74DRAFT_3870 [Chaetomium olivicolor]